MAIYHLNASVGSRKSGQAARAKYDYIIRSGKYTAGSREVLFSESGHMPEWASREPCLYWEAADLHERENASLFRQYEFSLPVELNEKERIALARKFVLEMTGGGKGEEGRMPYSWAIHRGGADGHNPHVHLIVSERLLLDGSPSPAPEAFFRDPRGGGCRKSRRFSGADRKKELVRIRERWASMANEALGESGATERIDHRSFADRGIDDLPGIHIGVATAGMEKKGIRTERGDRAVRRRRSRKRLRDLNSEKARIESEFKKEENHAWSARPDRSRQRQSRHGEQGRHDPQGPGRGQEKKRTSSENDLRQNGPDREEATFDPLNFGDGGRPVFDFGDLARRHHSRKIVQESGTKKSDYWKEWRERILTEEYGEEVRRTAVARWKVRKTGDAIEFQDWNAPQTKILDRGGEIEAGSGNIKEIRAMCELARIKRWKTVEWSGTEGFLRDAFRESLGAGVSVKLSDENQRRIWMEVQAESERARHNPDLKKINAKIKP